MSEETLFLQTGKKVTYVKRKLKVTVKEDDTESNPPGNLTEYHANIQGLEIKVYRNSKGKWEHSMDKGDSSNIKLFKQRINARELQGLS